MIEKLKVGYEYFLYEPSKTQVIIQHYLLNPVSKFIENILFWIIDKIRSILLIAHKIN